MWGKRKFDEIVNDKEEDMKFVCMEWSFVKLFWKFILLLDVNVDVIIVNCVDGVLMVIVFKILFFELVKLKIVKIVVD